MQKCLFTAYLLLQTIIYTQGWTAVPLTAPLTYQEWQEAKRLSQQTNGDTITLNDGSLLEGSFHMLPPLYYSFGQMSFNAEELDTVVFFIRDNSLKGQYITKDGQNFIATIRAEELPYHENQENLGVLKKIDIHLVKCIFFENGEPSYCKPKKDLFSLVLSNGDELPLSSESVLINVTEAGKSKKIPLADIVEVTFNGGLVGSILSDGSISTMGFALVNDKYFFAYLTRKHHLVKLPWTQISQIQGYNGGFKDRDLRMAAVAEPFNENLEIAFEANMLPEKKSPVFTIPTYLLGFAPEAFDVFEQPLDIQQKQNINHQAGVQAIIKLEGAPRRVIRF